LDSVDRTDLTLAQFFSQLLVCDDCSKSSYLLNQKNLKKMFFHLHQRWLKLYLRVGQNLCVEVMPMYCCQNIFLLMCESIGPF
jgi:hypothetical protein